MYFSVSIFISDHTIEACLLHSRSDKIAIRSLIILLKHIQIVAVRLSFNRVRQIYENLRCYCNWYRFRDEHR